MAPLVPERLGRAVCLAAEVHAAQVRKNGTPYISHPLAVASLVIAHGGDGEQAEAAILHDVYEDGGPEWVPRLQAEFGGRVWTLVLGCSDDRFSVAEPPWAGLSRADKAALWRARKERTLARLREAPADVLLVSGCDKLHNALMLADQARQDGQGVFERFVGRTEGVLWYYRSLAAVFADRGAPMAQALGEAVGAIEALALPPRPPAEPRPDASWRPG